MLFKKLFWICCLQVNRRYHVELMWKIKSAQGDKHVRRATAIHIIWELRAHLLAAIAEISYGQICYIFYTWRRKPLRGTWLKVIKWYFLEFIKKLNIVKSANWG